MVQLGAIRSGFLLGISLVLAAIIYFFAANWGGLDRMEKSILSLGLMCLFYGISYALTKLRGMLGHHAFLSAVLLVGGCISFGASVALLGQIYNSHADSYSLFLIWSLPALLLAWVTRYNPFYTLTYILIHLTLWFYFFPSTLFVDHTEGQLLLIGGIFALINLVLFVSLELNRLSSPILKLISFVVFHVALLRLTNSFEFEMSYGWTNLVSLAAITIGFYYFIQVRLNKTYLTLNALALSAFAVFKFVEMAMHFGSVMFFFYGLVFVAALLTANILFFRYLNRLHQHQGERTAIPEKEEPEANKKSDHGHVAGKVVSTIVTIIGVIIGTVSLCGVIFLASGPESPEYILFGLSVLSIILMIFLPGLNATVRYTVLTIGFIAGMISLVWIDSLVLTALFLVLSIAGWIRLTSRTERVFTYILLNINLMILLFQCLRSLDGTTFAPIVIILTILNTAVYFIHPLLKEGAARELVRDCGLYFTLGFLFWLTFFDDIFPYSYALFNLIFFILISYLLFYFLNRSQARDALFTSILWFIFIGFKYYDLLWSLFHKSVTLALLGIITLAVTYIVARRTNTADTQAGEYQNVWRKRAVWLLVIIVLQLGFLVYQASSSERLLTTGTSIKLEITPIDPRSLLQGDYVTLNYTISTVPESLDAELESYQSLSKVRVVLAPDERGVYELVRLYEDGDVMGENELVINGQASGWRQIYYGIETFFVPEGTGREVERDARFAYVRVSADGDAVLEKLTKE